MKGEAGFTSEGRSRVHQSSVVCSLPISRGPSVPFHADPAVTEEEAGFVSFCTVAALEESVKPWMPFCTCNIAEELTGLPTCEDARSRIGDPKLSISLRATRARMRFTCTSLHTNYWALCGQLLGVW